MLFISKEGEILNSEVGNLYYQKVKAKIDAWNNGQNRFVFFTSGSTGIPKEIIFNREQIIASVQTTKQAFDLNTNCLFFCNLHIDFVAGAMMVFRALVLEADLFVVEPSANPLLNLGRQELLLNKYRRRVFFAFAPMQMAEILNDVNSKDLLILAKVVLLGGAPVPKAMEEVLIESNLDIYEGYGMTETLSHVALRKLADKSKQFKILNNIKFRVSNDGCLELNYPVITNGWLKTNDIAEKINSKMFKILGRADNVINSGGIKLQIEAIEEKIRDSGIIKNRFFCFGLSDEKYGQKLVIYIESQEKGIDLSDFKSFLGKFELPKEIIFKDKFAETATLKIDKIKTVNEIS
jgi:o-succinylbenzoate---CoA ligase